MLSAGKILKPFSGCVKSVRCIVMYPDKTFVNNQWTGASSSKTFPVLNPATGVQIGTVPDMDDSDARKAIQVARQSFTDWSQTTAVERSQILNRFYDQIIEHTEELAGIITAENGKPLAESRGEVAYAAKYIEWFAGEARRTCGEVIPTPSRDRRIFVVKQPAGVCGVITPWNFPLAMMARKVGALLAAGCTTVAKPAEDTPFSSIALAELACKAGLPAGVFNVVTATRQNSILIGKEMSASPDISVISFTGSTNTGKILMRQSADTVQRVCLELGGNCPFIVFDSADLDLAVKGAMGSTFRTAGQACVGPNRLYVQEGVYDKFVEKLSQAVQALVVGDGSKPGTTLGPVINQSSIDKISRIVTESQTAGAKVLTGGTHQGNFFQPTVLTNVTEDMSCAKEEIFGPVAPVYKFSTEAEAVTRANNTRYGLAAYCYTRDPAQGWRVSELLESGMVGINEAVISCVEIPFGGYKESGLGREGGLKYGIEEYLETKYICLGGL